MNYDPHRTYVALLEAALARCATEARAQRCVVTPIQCWTIAYETARELGWDVVDKSIVNMLAAQLAEEAAR